MEKELVTERISLIDLFKIMTGEPMVDYLDDEEDYDAS